MATVTLDSVNKVYDNGFQAIYDLSLEIADSEDVGMIFMGSRGLSDARALFLGSVSHKVTNHAACTCVTVK